MSFFVYETQICLHMSTDVVHIIYQSSIEIKYTNEKNYSIKKRLKSNSNISNVDDELSRGNDDILKEQLGIDNNSDDGDVATDYLKESQSSIDNGDLACHERFCWAFKLSNVEFILCWSLKHHYEPSSEIIDSMRSLYKTNMDNLNRISISFMEGWSDADELLECRFCLCVVWQ
ncbi:hypothetical protein BDA99DRAFT_533255 [Phascolomyces articulosus]|uniref:Uncharacterized protein n=1 Tax=Phascolomyces articulosus TaxID=60185 RepID=A0AAD5KKE7_9FUNG|nr:hypothetical protein BDA99DRAFT_533255 [Phascolomyces articulosus]